MESIIDNRKECFFCRSQYGLERHHCLHGTANRKLAEEDGLWVWLCPACHRGKYGVHGYAGHEYDMTLKKTAEWAWLQERGYIRNYTPNLDGIALFVKRYGKNFL